MAWWPVVGGLPIACGDEPGGLPSEVQSIFEHRCISCHNDTDRKGDFSLQSRESLVDSGYLIPGQPNDSSLLAVLLPDGTQPPTMPANGTPLSAAEVDAVRDWISGGASWPDGRRLEEPAVSDFDWWSLKPVVRPSVPETASKHADFGDWMRNDVDAFVAQRLLEHGLRPSKEADRPTLIRRVCYDLTGLPPTPEQLDAFVNDGRIDAYERLVDELLDSPRYGEHWARHWLDVVRYADTCGYDKDKLRPNAWPYRDYVIRSFNDDKPYTRFVQEQIAGDALFPGDGDGILGLGFLAAGPWDFIGHVEVPESKQDGMVARHLDRDEMVCGTLNTFCSVTIQCARCHNHKFDPFTQQHYYSLQAVFAAVDRAERAYDLSPEVEQQKTRLQRRIADYEQQVKAFDRKTEELGGDQLKALNQNISRLQKQAAPQNKPPEFGYHSQISKQQTDSKWVEVDLESIRTIDHIVLNPCHDDYAGIGAGFGFPLRYEISISEDGQNYRPVKSSNEAGSADEERPNPGIAPVEVACEPTTGRYVRVTAKKLAPRSNDYIFALAELQVFDDSGSNVAAQKAVRSIDSIEAPPRWRAKNLTDGRWPVAESAEAVAQLAAALKERSEILQRVLPKQRQQQKESLQSDLKSAREELSQLPAGKMVYAAATHFKPQGNFRPTEGRPRTIHVLHRGNLSQPQEEAFPGRIPTHVNDVPLFELAATAPESERRAALARWITRPDHPLTWRSIVNRIWQYHFGRAIVDSPNDFGRMGARPTHPELLDWLADEFRSTQSFKHLHRLMVLSATYRQSSAADESTSLKSAESSAAMIDAENHFLSHMNRRRLSAEEVRDSMLLISGRLDLKMGGPGFYLFELERPEHSPHYEYHKFDPSDPVSHRRSIYRFVVRSQPDPYMTTLDCADSSQSSPRRMETLTSLQALTLLNNRFSLQMAQYFAERLGETSTERLADIPNQVTQAFLLTAARRPDSDELSWMTEYARRHGMVNLCRILFNTSEFLFVD